MTLAEFQELYESDEFYSWFGLSSPLMYAAHKAAGGMTSIYRQIGIGCHWVFAEVLQDHLGLAAQAANWSYTVKSRGKKPRRLWLDARIPLDQIIDAEAKIRVQKWLHAACDEIGLPNPTRQNLQGSVFEVRQGYKSKDSKRQNADVANASNDFSLFVFLGVLRENPGVRTIRKTYYFAFFHVLMVAASVSCCAAETSGTLKPAKIIAPKNLP